jgi:hypothetical protein
MAVIFENELNDVILSYQQFVAEGQQSNRSGYREM